MRRTFRILLTVVCVAAGALLAEGWLRLVVPEYIYFGRGSIPPLCVDHPRYGHAFIPNYRGRVADVSGDGPLVLDERGFRATVQTEPDDPGVRVLFLCGVSVIQEIHAADNATVPAFVARLSPRPLTAINASWFGYSLPQGFCYYREMLQDVPCDLTVICLFPRGIDYEYDRIDTHDLFDRPYQFKFDFGPMIWVDGFSYPEYLPNRYGWLWTGYLHSYLVHGLSKRVEEVWEKKKVAVFYLQKARLCMQDPPAAAALANYTTPQGQDESVRRLLLAIDGWFRERNRPMVFVIFPSPRNANEMDFRRWEGILAPLDGRVRAINLLDISLPREEWRDESHYFPEGCRRVGGALAERIQPYLPPAGKADGSR
jgi:hypothetical protein